MDSFSFEAVSPFVRYSPPVASPAVSEQGSAAWALTKDNTRHFGYPFYQTSTTGAGFRFSFFGTGFTLSGSSVCLFTTTIDKNRTIDRTSLNLGEIDDLALAEHEVDVAVTSCPETGVFEFMGGTVRGWGRGQSLMVDRVVDDSDPHITYSGSWTSIMNSSLTENTNQTQVCALLTTTARLPLKLMFCNRGFTLEYHIQHFTTSADSSFSYTFHSSLAVRLRGSLKSPGAPYSITLDGHTWNFSSSISMETPPLPLFFHAGLDPLKEYTLVGRTLGTGYFDLDQIYTHGPSNLNHNSNSSQPSPESDSESNGGSLARGAVIGIAVTLSVVFLALLILLFRYQQRRYILPKPRPRPRPDLVPSPNPNPNPEPRPQPSPQPTHRPQPVPSPPPSPRSIPVPVPHNPRHPDFSSPPEIAELHYHYQSPSSPSQLPPARLREKDRYSVEEKV